MLVATALWELALTSTLHRALRRIADVVSLGCLVLLADGRLPMARSIGMAGIPLFAHAGLKKTTPPPLPCAIENPGFGS